MEKKILLFNYFIEKCLDNEKMFLKTDDFKTLMLGLAFAKASVFHRNISGCSSETVYFIKPKFLQEMFVLLCLNAYEHGDDLFKVFDFNQTYAFHGQHSEQGDFEDVELTSYLNKVYVETAPLKPEEEAMYTTLAKVEKLTPEMFPHHRFSLKRVAVDELEVSQENDFTKMIDRAFERMSQSEEFIQLFLVSGKYDLYGISKPYSMYIRRLNELFGEHF